MPTTFDKLLGKPLLHSHSSGDIDGEIDESKLSESVNESLDLADTAVQPADLAAVATTGSYNDLSNTPTIPDSLDDLSGDSDDIDEGASNLFMTSSERSKLSGIESGAEVNNISDANATDLTDGGATTLHKHDHGTLDGLSDDDHSQYALLAGRSGGQTLIGGTASGNNLTLQSTSHATKGKIILGTSAYDEVNNRLGIGTTTPSTRLDVAGGIRATSATIDAAVSTQGVYSFYQRELSTALNTLQIAFTRGAGTTQFGAVSMIALMSGRVSTTTYKGAVLINIQSRFSSTMVDSTADLMAGITVTKTTDTQTALTLTLDLGITGSGFTELTCQIFPIGNTNSNITMTPTVITV